LFDEFESNAEEKFELRLTHNKRDNEKKVASMDKILNDMRKKYENESRQSIDEPVNSSEFSEL
jgi:hypothetical protein